MSKFISFIESHYNLFRLILGAIFAFSLGFFGIFNNVASCVSSEITDALSSTNLKNTVSVPAAVPDEEFL